VLAKEAQDPARPDISSSSGILVTNFQNPGFSYGSFSYTVKKMEFRWRKRKKRNERDIERALGSRGTFL